jgi:integrase
VSLSSALETSLDVRRALAASRSNFMRNAVSAAWAHFADNIGQPAVTFHALRHTHASQLIDAHVDIVTISKRLGHAKPDTTLRVYAHLFRKDDGKAAAAINAALAT